jgi:hypothetical protein
MTKLTLNIHLSKQFDDNNNNVAVEENFQRRFSVNVWCGIFGDRMDINRIRDAIACVIIVIYYTSGLNECLTSDAFNSASGEAASALTSQVKHSFSP